MNGSHIMYEKRSAFINTKNISQLITKQQATASTNKYKILKQKQKIRGKIKRGNTQITGYNMKEKEKEREREREKDEERRKKPDV